jgi:cephalosporin-C deacetylase-like acetyl esterase
MSGLVAESYAARNAALAKLTTPAAIRERQRWVTETFWTLTGGKPERTPLNARKTGEFEREAYKVEKLVYESRPNFYIPANLYIPKNAKPPYPGVLFQMGHSTNGKAAETYQKCCQGLVQLGFLVLGFDPMGQGERIYYPGGQGASRLGSADDEHTYPGKQMLLTGDTSTRMQAWDAMRSLDYLAAHPLVDSKRLATTGQSGGGTLSMFLAAIDDRLAAAAVSCGNTENFACANYNPPGSTDDAEQNFAGGSAAGFERWDLLYPLAPKPLLILVSAKDFFGTYSPRYISNGWEEFQKLERIYAALGKPAQLAWADTPLPHGLAYHLRLRIYQWLVRWMQPGAPPVKAEPPVKLEPDEALLAKPPAGETPFSMNQRRAAAIRTPDACPQLGSLLGVSRMRSPMRILGTADSRGCKVQSIEVASAPKVWIPAWLFVPAEPDSTKPALVLLEPSGRSVRWGDDALYQELARAGFHVCVPDLRGIGDLTPEFPRAAARHGRNHAEEEHWTWAGLTIGKPLVGQRTTDILAVVDALRPRRVAIAAQGRLTVPALFAAALEPSVSALYLSSGLVSFRAVVESETWDHPFANFVPRLLEHTDLPQLAASLAPRPVRLAGTLSAAGKRMRTDAVRALYNSANVSVTEESAWDATVLAKW